MPAAAPRDWLSDGTLVLKTVVGYEFTLLLADDNQLFTVGKAPNFHFLIRAYFRFS